ncbi:NUDIX domain-containing protein [Nocardia altamirensis]|uniref:NUDIX domain-containing protein n=1 Tax=Nocardia altamirensis TaxID=472158 RepID=UPI00084026F1|nr:NUDIX domain-containing protein [Nocardia altamirensis]
MEPATAAVAEIVRGIVPLDRLEQEHKQEALAWLAATDDIFRRHKPATPSPHLVVYVVPVDPAGRGILLGRHRLSRLWLPPGGHVEPGEHPLAAARREAREEMDVEAEFGVVGIDPLLLTVTSVHDADGGHVDCSLWYLICGDRTQESRLDPREFDGGRWWDIDRFGTPESDPHFIRFVTKLEGALAPRAIW